MCFSYRINFLKLKKKHYMFCNFSLKKLSRIYFFMSTSFLILLNAHPEELWPHKVGGDRGRHDYWRSLREALMYMFWKGLSDWLGWQSLYIVPCMIKMWHIKPTKIWYLCTNFQVRCNMSKHNENWLKNPWFSLTFLLANGKMVLSKLVEFWSSICNGQQPQSILTIEYLKVIDFNSILELQFQTLLFNTNIWFLFNL